MRWLIRAEVADEAILRPDLNVASRAFRAIHEHRTNRRSVRITDRKFFEPETVDQLVASLFGESRSRAGRDSAGSDQRFFDVMPATRLGVRMGAFLRDRRRFRQLRVEMRIDLRDGRGELPFLGISG